MTPMPGRGAGPEAGAMAPAPVRADPSGDLSGWTDALLVAVALAYAAFVALLTFVRGVPVTPDVVALAAAFAIVIVLRKRLPRRRDGSPVSVVASPCR